MSRVFLASLYVNKSQHWKRRLVSEVYSDGTFELVPIPSGWTNAIKGDRTYDEVPSWHDPKASLAELLRYDVGRAKTIVHDDPDLHTHFAYGDGYAPKSAALFNAEPGDWLLMIANLAFAHQFGEPVLTHPRTGWYFVGCLHIKKVDLAGAGKFHDDSLSHHQHWRDAKYRRYDLDPRHSSVIVAGLKTMRCQRFTNAVPVLSKQAVARLLRDKNGRRILMDEAGRGGQHKFTSVMSCVGSYTRAIRSIGDTECDDDNRYLSELRREIMRYNPAADSLLWR